MSAFLVTHLRSQIAHLWPQPWRPWGLVQQSGEACPEESSARRALGAGALPCGVLRMLVVPAKFKLKPICVQV